jgi:hypothetical protein
LLPLLFVPGTSRSRSGTSALTATAEQWRPPTTRPGEPPPLSTRGPGRGQCLAARSGRLQTLSRITS